MSDWMIGPWICVSWTFARQETTARGVGQIRDAHIKQAKVLV